MNIYFYIVQLRAEDTYWLHNSGSSVASDASSDASGCCASSQQLLSQIVKERCFELAEQCTYCSIAVVDSILYAANQMNRVRALPS